MREKVIFAWSGGKDSSMALYELKKNKNLEISALLTTMTQDYKRVSIHGVRSVLLERQADALGLPLEQVNITKDSSSEEYEVKMRDKLGYYKKRGVSTVAFGDIFLEDLRKYRQEKLAGMMKAVFPIWKRDTGLLAHDFIDLGFKAITTCVDSNFLSQDFAGREFDGRFLSELPRGVDPCGENGEFHTFVYDGPIFKNSIGCQKKDVILRDSRFYYCELLPVGQAIDAAV